MFAAALEAMRAGGVELVPMDMDLVIQLGKKDLPDTTFYTYEYPRELSRCVAIHAACTCEPAAGRPPHCLHIKSTLSQQHWSDAACSIIVR